MSKNKTKQNSQQKQKIESESIDEIDAPTKNNRTLLWVILAILLTMLTVITALDLGRKQFQEKLVRHSQSQEKLVKQNKTVVNCEALGRDWTLFDSSNTTLSFCYQPVWGNVAIKETEIDPRARIGTMYYVDFVNLRNDDYVLISYSTPDFKKIGNRDVSDVIDWSKLDFSHDSTQLVQLLPDSENTKGVKLMINNKQVFKVYREIVLLGEEKKTQVLDYFMPNVNIDGNLYNLSIKSSISMEDEADKLLESLIF